MNKAQIGGVVRALLAAFAGYAAGKKWIGADFPVEETAALLTTIIVTVWSVKSNKEQAQ